MPSKTGTLIIGGFKTEVHYDLYPGEQPNQYNNFGRPEPDHVDVYELLLYGVSVPIDREDEDWLNGEVFEQIENRPAYEY